MTYNMDVEEMNIVIEEGLRVNMSSLSEEAEAETEKKEVDRPLSSNMFGKRLPPHTLAALRRQQREEQSRAGI